MLFHLNIDLNRCHKVPFNTPLFKDMLLLMYVCPVTAFIINTLTAELRHSPQTTDPITSYPAYTSASCTCTHVITIRHLQTSRSAPHEPHNFIKEDFTYTCSYNLYLHVLNYMSHKANVAVRRKHIGGCRISYISRNV